MVKNRKGADAGWWPHRGRDAGRGGIESRAGTMHGRELTKVLQ